MHSSEKKSSENEAVSKDARTARAGARRTLSAARDICAVAVMAAALECVKLALSAIPNVEAVTLLVGVFSSVFGYLGVLATLVFVCLEPLIWGFGTWVVSYFLYWPFLALAFAIFFRRESRLQRLSATLFALIMTLWFGVLSSLVEVGLFSGSYDNFLYRFSIYYLRGVGFYLLQLCSNAVLFPLLYPFLRKILSRAARSFLHRKL